MYELYSAGGSLECRNVLSVGHAEIKRLIEDEVSPLRNLPFACASWTLL